MAFIRKKKSIRGLLLILLTVVLLLSAAGGGYYFYNKIVNGMKLSYEEKITELKLNEYNNKRQVFVPLEDIMKGTILTRELFEEKDIISSLDKELYISENDFGKIALIDMKKDIPPIRLMLSEESIDNDVREEEFNMFLLQSNLIKDKYVDLRISFPNGEDYIVLSKKKIRLINLEENTIWLWLNEKEILTVSSAIVDAYMKEGTKLYVVTYVEPNIQKEAIPTYPVNLDVLKVMERDPNIVNRAKDALAQNIRAALDERLNKLSVENISNINDGVSQEVNKRSDAIIKDKEKNEVQEEAKKEIDGETTEGEKIEEGSDKSGFFN